MPGFARFCPATRAGKNRTHREHTHPNRPSRLPPRHPTTGRAPTPENVRTRPNLSAPARAGKNEPTDAPLLVSVSTQPPPFQPPPPAVTNAPVEGDTAQTSHPSRSAASANGRVAVAVIGCGRMGKLHARVYSQMPQVQLAGVFDANPEVAEEVAGEYGCRAFGSLEELLARVKAVTIAVPTKCHLETAEPCLRRGVACLIEKPLAKDVAQATRIVELADQCRTPVQVGHIERFNPAVRAMDRLNINPGFIEVVRISPLTFRSIDVGVVLDMMIHDIDIVLKLARSKVKEVHAVGVSVIGEVEDVCNARLTFENGCVANITASRLALKTERRLRVFSPDAYVSLDYQKRYGMVAHRSGNLDAIRDAVAKIRRGEIEDLSQLNYQDLVHVQELQIDDVEPLRAELDSFIDAIRNGRRPVVSAEDGLAAVDIATRIVQSISPNSLG